MSNLLKLRWAVCCLLVVEQLCVMHATALAHTATGEKWMAATVNPLATDAAVAVFREGGNAVDAAVTAALTLGVVDGFNSGIGGGCLILIRSADGNLIAIDGRETAPAAATKDMFLRDGRPIPDASTTGPLASGVPGALAAYQLAVEKCGTMNLARLLQPGVRAATDGFPLSQGYAKNIKDHAKIFRRFEGSRAVFLSPDGQPWPEGHRFVQPGLANTYRHIAERGTDWFYRGPFAEKVGAWMAANGGIMTAADFANYQAKLRQPIKTTYRGYQIIGFPPPSSGGVHVAEILNILEPFDLRAIEKRDPVEASHIMLEAFKLAFADRAYWLGDSDFADVPMGLIAKSYARELAGKIDPKRAVEVAGPGSPPGWKQDFFGRHTTHIAAADAAGNWVAITATVNTSFGSKVVVPGTGVVLNDEMDDFSIMPGVPNAFGLVGAENNSIAPGKRPLSSMSPTIVLDSAGRPFLAVGAAGGPKIITQVVLAIVRIIDFQQPLAVAIEGLRFHHQWRPNKVAFEEGMVPKLVEGWKARGHTVDQISTAGRSQAIIINPAGQFTGVSDPRVAGKAAGE
jgi:gamma-glutamyltranspeptidase/glutathione hydrolase